MKNAFIDSNNVLVGWGYCETNGEGTTAIPVDDDFALESGAWRLVDDHWVEHQPTLPPRTVFSSLEYLSKFSDIEYQAARTGSMRAQRALDMLIAAQYVDIVNDPRVPGALDIMTADCGMAPERKAELLTPQAA